MLISLLLLLSSGQKRHGCLLVSQTKEVLSRKQLISPCCRHWPPQPQSTHCLSLLPCLPVPLPGEAGEPAAPGFLWLHFRRASLFQGCLLFPLSRPNGGRQKLSTPPRSQNQQRAHAGHGLCKALSSARTWSALASSSPTLCLAAGDSPPHFFISTIIFFFPMGANARKCSRLLQHALSSPLSSRTKMGGVGKDGKVFMCPVLPHLISPPCWSTGAVGGMAGEASQLVSSAPSSADLVWPHRSQTP